MSADWNEERNQIGQEEYQNIVNGNDRKYRRLRSRKSQTLDKSTTISISFYLRIFTCHLWFTSPSVENHTCACQEAFTTLGQTRESRRSESGDIVFRSGRVN
jgi:hypothetical protein